MGLPVGNARGLVATSGGPGLWFKVPQEATQYRGGSETMHPSVTSVTDLVRTNSKLGLTGEEVTTPHKEFLLASDFDQTLSFNDSGLILSEMLGRRGFKEKVDGLARIHLVQQGGELAYLLLHDPEY